MFGKRYTILIFPHSAKGVRKLSIPRFFLLAVSVVFIGLAAFAMYTHHRLIALNDQQAELDRLRRKNIKQNVQIHALADKTRRLQEQMVRLTQHDRELRALTRDQKTMKRFIGPALGGSDSESDNSLSDPKIDRETLTKQMHQNLDSLLAQAGYLEQSQNELARDFEDIRSLIAATPDSWPCSGSISSGFGYRMHPISRRKEFHRGLDISGPLGTPIHAPADGIVVQTIRRSGYGLMIVVNHGYGTMTRYGHLSKYFVKPGQRVVRGQQIGAMGRSGRTTGCHLHYEVIINGMAVNPVRYLARR